MVVPFAALAGPEHNGRVLAEDDRPTRRDARPSRFVVGSSNRGAERRPVVVAEQDKATARLAALSDVVSERTPDTIERVLEAAREELGMDVAFVSEFTRRRMVFREMVGEAASFGWEEGGSVPLDDTFCKLLLEGHLPNVIPDAKADGRVRFLEITGKAGIGSYVGAPIRFSDGTLYGTLCFLSHSPEPSLSERDGRFVRVLARLVAEQIERERRLLRRTRERARAHERRIIGRELHDRVAHTMGVVGQSLQLYEVYREHDPEAAQQKLELAKRKVAEAMKDTRDLSEALRASEGAGEELELEEALSELLENVVPPEMEGRLSVSGEEGPVSAEVREQLFLVLREAVRNTVSHAGAGRVSVEVRTDSERIVGVVEDDGRGFDRRPRGKRSEAGGLAYMAERASLLGGTCSIESAPGRGTRVETSFPLDAVESRTR
jgi:signal transduction histidine kinase